MNIMKTNMLLLDNKRIMKEETSNGTVVQAPVPETNDSQKGMNALSFQGMKNVMANPQLSSKLANVATTAKEGIKNNGAKALAGMMLVSTLLPSAMLVSCDKINIDEKQEQSVVVDVSAMVAMLEKLYEAQLLTLQEYIC